MPDRAAEPVPNKTADPKLIEFFGKIGPGNYNFDHFVKEFGETTVRGSEGGHDSVHFQFRISTDGESFSPTLEQAMEYSPDTLRIVYAVRSGGGVKRAAAKKKAAPKKAAVKKFAARKATRKSASRRMAR